MLAQAAEQVAQVAEQVAQVAEQVEAAQGEKKENHPPATSAGNGLIQFYYSLINIHECEWMLRMDAAMMYSTRAACGSADARGGSGSCGGSAGGHGEHRLSLRAGGGESDTCVATSTAGVHTSGLTSTPMF